MRGPTLEVVVQREIDKCGVQPRQLHREMQLTTSRLLFSTNATIFVTIQLLQNNGLVCSSVARVLCLKACLVACHHMINGMGEGVASEAGRMREKFV